MEMLFFGMDRRAVFLPGVFAALFTTGVGTVLASFGLSEWRDLAFWFGGILAALSLAAWIMYWLSDRRVAFAVIGSRIQDHKTKDRAFVVGVIKKRRKGVTAPVAIRLVGLARLENGKWEELLINGYPLALSRLGEASGFDPAPLREEMTLFAFLTLEKSDGSLSIRWRENYSSLVNELRKLPHGEYRVRFNVSDDRDSVTTTAQFGWSGNVHATSFQGLRHSPE